MTVSTSIPATIQMRRSRLLGLMAAVALMAAGITWALVAVAGDSGSGAAQRSVKPAVSSPSSSDQSYVKAITSLTPVQMAAAFGGPGAVADARGLESFKQFAKGISSMASAQQTAAVLGALGLSAQDRQYVMGITSMSPTQQAAAFGGPAVRVDSSFKQFAKGISSLASAQQTAAVLNALGLSAQDAQYVQGITSMSRTQQAAAFGR